MDCIKILPILLPRADINIDKWAVIAVDQFTSDAGYWDKITEYVGDSPSTLHLVLPEVYLGQNDDERMQGIFDTMAVYQKNGVLREGPGMIGVTRTTPRGGVRRGVMTCIDLECYSYLPEHGLTAIRPSEKTVLERVPPRLKIRASASLELPHALLFADDPANLIMQAAHKTQGDVLYEGALNGGGGSVKGTTVDIPAVQAAIAKVQENAEKHGRAAFAVADGNHGLAAARAHWETVKTALGNAGIKFHPARYALVEIVNLYDASIRFEAIHRVVYGADTDFLEGLHHNAIKPSVIKKEGGRVFYRPAETHTKLANDAVDAVKFVDGYIEAYQKEHPGVRVDYVHGVNNLQSAIARGGKGTYAIVLPILDKISFFKRLQGEGTFPKKTFSTGAAVEKRYYLEARKII